MPHPHDRHIHVQVPVIVALDTYAEFIAVSSALRHSRAHLKKEMMTPGLDPATAEMMASLLSAHLDAEEALTVAYVGAQLMSRELHGE